MAAKNFYQVLTDAVKFYEQNGFDNAHDLEYWTEMLRQAAIDSLVPENKLVEELKKHFGAKYDRLIQKGQIIQFHKGIERFTIEKLKPQLRNELDRRIMASASLIQRNRQQMIEKTLQRFSGWATSIPIGGSRAVSTSEIKEDIKKPIKSISFLERRVAIDQGAKFVSALNEIIAIGGGAIAAKWHSQWRRPGYDYREDHKERDLKYYLFRNSWARERGYVKPNENGYFDEITKPGEEVYCSCSATYVYTLSALPDDMITAKGKIALSSAKNILTNK